MKVFGRRLALIKCAGNIGLSLETLVSNAFGFENYRLDLCFYLFSLKKSTCERFPSIFSIGDVSYLSF